MSFKRILYPQRLRQIPKQFSWIDQRLVSDGHICNLNPEASALYLFLLTVADAQGLSFYGDRSICRKISLSDAQLQQARSVLIHTGLIGYQRPLYQVLSLLSAAPANLPVPKPRQKLSHPLPIGDILSKPKES